jgi:hypothetical protein
MKIRSIAKKKVSDFLLGEAGQVGRRGTFTVAALASASGLAAFLVATPPAEAGGIPCGDDGWCCGWDKYCCHGVCGDEGLDCRYAGGPC